MTPDSGPSPAVRYPYEPVGREFATDADAAAALGVTRRNIQRWRRQGVSWVRCYDIADRLRVHPFVLWPELRAVAESEAEAATLPCGNDGCGERFIPVTSSHRYCSPRCRVVAKLRRRHVDRGPRVCASTSCDRVFTPELTTGAPAIYCSKTCRHRENMRTYRQTEAGKQSNRRYVRRYKAEVREILARRKES